MKYQKYITVMQMAMGVTASNKDCLPTKRQLWVTTDDGDTASLAPYPGDLDGPPGTSSTLSLPMSQGKPSLRRIKGRIHRSKSLDSMDMLDTEAVCEFVELCGTLWNFMGLYRTLWGSMEPYGALWNTMGLYGTLWNAMGLYGTLWGSMEHYGPNNNQGLVVGGFGCSIQCLSSP
ncbi:hypothetical protein NHX12_005670 [Muraenolepis orangiensis]|uniref:Uncharacterized protein n=1 Tax=Muraenolepis orangiensis TaxID=630683 RepID=A0A9Q0ICE6_9TELE|nr:hypothetical protein NHX12_005670 [Muraenolepis orangiensis]